MAKPSAFMRQMEEKAKAGMRLQRLFTIQQCEDIMVIMLHREFGFGAERSAKALREFRDIFRQYAQQVIADADGDKQMDYTKGCIDRELKAALGDDFKPWEVRYPKEVFERRL